jgi:hypothetical protein
MSVRLRALMLAGAMALSGCGGGAAKPELDAGPSAPAGAPTPAPEAVASPRAAARMLSEVQFDAAMQGALAPTDAYQEERNYTAILARADVSEDQKARALYMRALVRGTTASNLNGAINDYDSLLRMIPAEHRLFRMATDGRAYAVRQKQAIDARVARGPAAQQPAAYVDDLMYLGRHAEAVGFIRAQRFSPTPLQAEKLTKLGFMCEGPGYAGPAFNWGTHLVHWCDTRPSAPARTSP